MQTLRIQTPPTRLPLSSANEDIPSKGLLYFPLPSAPARLTARWLPASSSVPEECLNPVGLPSIYADTCPVISNCTQKKAPRRQCPHCPEAHWSLHEFCTTCIPSS